jgi:hypothetical protein
MVNFSIVVMARWEDGSVIDRNEATARMAALRAKAECVQQLLSQLEAAQALAADPGPADPEQEDWDIGERDEDLRRKALAAVDDLRAALADLLP